MNKKRVTLVEINIFDQMLPLVSGYLQSYALTDPLVAQTYEFDKYTSTVNTPFQRLLDDLSAQDSFIYAFSCYLWNMGLVRSLVSALLKTNPRAWILLGGPQVMRHAEDYLDASHERLLLCNGEGERSFKQFLQALNAGEPDLGVVGGLSFYRDGALITTPPQPRIQDLDEVPSPFNAEILDGEYRMAVIETNRGCPFRCSFCYWGAATNDRVYKLSESRVRNDISWLSEHFVPLLYIADANWGMLRRDVGLSRHIAACKENSGAPFYVYFAAAKNSPGRVAEISEVFERADMLNTQPISMQTLNESSLERVDRKNIKLGAYESLQNRLNENGVSSYIELIWPLPGETLQSFRLGIEKLCEREAAHIIAYPHMLLHNTPMYTQRQEHGLVTRVLEDTHAEAELVVGTADVPAEDFKLGLRFFYVVLALYNTRALARLSHYLHGSGKCSYSALFTAFADYCSGYPGSGFSRYCEQSIENASYYEVENYPFVYHIVLHENRLEFQSRLHGFAVQQDWWQCDKARGLFELDMLSMPYLYSNTPLRAPDFPLEHVRLSAVEESSFIIEIPPGSPVAGVDGFEAGAVRLDHSRSQQPFSEKRKREENASYCSGTIMRIENVLPLRSNSPLTDL
jgi:hypothetical protein